MESKYNDVEQLFIKEILDQHGEFLTDLFVDSIQSKKLEDTGTLLNAISYKVEKRGNNFVLNFQFPDYGRFVEIRFHKSKNTQKLLQLNTNRKLWNIRGKDKPKKKSKDARWYTKNVYGSQNKLISRLGTEFTEQEITRLKNIIAESQRKGTYASLLAGSNTNTKAI
jgi:hypothetical protein